MNGSGAGRAGAGGRGPAPALVLVSHSLRLAEGLRDLVEQVAGGRVRVAVAAGSGDGDLGTDPLRIAQAVEEAGGGPVLVLMDLGSAVLSAELALDMLPEDLRRRAVLCDAPLVEGAVAAAAVLAAGGSVEEAAAEARRALAAKQAHLGGATGPAGEAASDPGPSPGQVRLRVRVVNPMGLHARPAARFVQVAAGFDARIRVRNLTRGGQAADAASPTQLALLDARAGDELELTASGPDAAAAAAALRDLVASGFGEAGGTPDPGVAPQPAAAPVAVRAPGAAPGAAPAPGALPALDVPPELAGAARVLRGVPAAPGAAVGRLVRLAPPDEGAAGKLPPSDLRSTAGDDGDALPGSPEDAWARLDAARSRAAADLAALAAAAPEGSPAAGILAAQRAMLDDPDLLARLRSAVFDRGLGAAAAWRETLDGLATRYRQAQAPMLRERAADVEDLRDRVLALLAGPGRDAPGPALVGDTGGEPAILAAGELGPAALMALGRSAAVAGLCLAGGGPTAHAVILARSLGLPVVAGLGPELLDVAPGTPVAVDGDLGLVLVEPGDTARRVLSARAEAARRAREEAEKGRHAPAVMRGGRRVQVAANAGGAGDVAQAMQQGAEGIGLLRTEFLFLDRPEPPGEEEQLAVYLEILAAADPHPVIIRTLDAGGDKPLPYLDTGPEENPFLGVRGLRLSLARPDLFRTQLRAVVRAAREAGPGRVRLMFPMVSTLEEVEAALAHLEAAGGRPPGLEVGVMVEVPAAALMAGHLARLVDFFSIGSNDLTQYVLAAERGSARLAALQDPLHPAVLALIAGVVEAAHGRGRWVGVCGEMAGDPVAAALLAGLGVDELSMVPARVPEIKALLRRLDEAEARAAAREALGLASASAVRAAALRRLPILAHPSRDAPHA
ncbi:MAG: phosphoenolpyruvate--protein phosphotransferase [Bacillota bacterium]